MITHDRESYNRLSFTFMYAYTPAPYQHHNAGYTEKATFHTVALKYRYYKFHLLCYNRKDLQNFGLKEFTTSWT